VQEGVLLLLFSLGYAQEPRPRPCYAQGAWPCYAQADRPLLQDGRRKATGGSQTQTLLLASAGMPAAQDRLTELGGEGKVSPFRAPGELQPLAVTLPGGVAGRGSKVGVGSKGHQPDEIQEVGGAV
jgi:hypothetical protein